MTDINDRPDQVFLTGQETLDRGTSRPKVKISQTYQPPLDGTADDFHAVDMWLCREVMTLLTKAYYGYAWHVKADSKQGIVAFNIPELMGETLHYVINLAQFSDLTPELVIKGGGELLERMDLPRHKFEIALYMQALQRRETFDFADSLKKRKAVA